MENESEKENQKDAEDEIDLTPLRHGRAHWQDLDLVPGLLKADIDGEPQVKALIEDQLKKI